MARERSIKVRLLAEISDFQRQMGQASRTLTDFEREQQKLGGAATTSLGRMAQSARINQQEWATLGRAMLTAGATVTAVGGAALKVGVDYNSLRQSATQSMTAVTGSTEAAAEQMRRLDEFGKNSWLMRDTLVRAQTQMTGFGISTEKVIPYMDGLAEAVAAAGGSNQDFEELARVMGKVQSTGKLTARELEQFGHRGIDAAEMIGVAMGKSGTQIREEITSGSLDAGVALDALAEGMKTTWEGSTELVRNTFSGAIDNAKAAFRDLMAELATPLVNPEGGGALVDLFNGLSDALRELEQWASVIPEPLKAVGLAIGGLGAAGLVMGGTFLALLPQIFAVGDALATLKAGSTGTALALRNFGRTAGPIGIAVAAVAALVAGLEALNKVEVKTFDSSEFTAGVLDAAEGLDGAATNLDRFFDVTEKGYWNATEGLDGLADALERVGNKSFTDSLRDFTSFLPGISNADFTAAIDGIAGIDEALAGLVSSGNIEEAEDVWLQIIGKGAEAGQSIGELTERFPAYHAALQEAQNQTRLTGDATGELGDGAEELAGDVDTATGAIRRHIDALIAQENKLRDAADATLSTINAEIGYHDQLDKTTAVIKENGATLDLKTEKGRENQRALNDLRDAGLAHVDAMREEGATTRELQVEVEKIRAKFVEQAEAAGLSAREANNLADKLGLIPGDYRAKINVETDVALGRIGALQSAIDRIKDKNVRITATAGTIGNIPGLGLVNRGMMADGGVRVRSFAGGGFSSLPKQAVIQAAKPGLIQWAEPETEGEAFIPLARSKRARSLAIWQETGRQLGAIPRSFAAGAVNVPSPARASFSGSLSLSSVDVERIAAAVERGSSRGSASGVSAGFAGGSSGVARFARMGG